MNLWLKKLKKEDYDKLLNEPNYYSFNDWIPKDIEFLEKKIIKVFNDSIGNNFHLKSLKLKFSDDIVENNHELLVIENPCTSISIH